MADHADAYLKQAAREEQRQNRPENFGSVSESRRDAFQ